MSHTGRALPPYIAPPNHTALDRLENDFLALHAMSDAPQARGYHFERLLTTLFNAWNMDAKGGFRLTGEQIDGSFQHGGTTYLLEAKWHRAKTDAEKLHAFQGKLTERLEGTRGLFVSFEGFTDGALDAFTARRIILADGMDTRPVSHPADDARMSVVLAVLGQIGCERDADAVRRAWKELTNDRSSEKTALFDLCYPPAALSDLASAAVAAFRECGIVGFSIQNPPKISGLLQDAWHMFWSPTTPYETWERNARIRLLDEIS